MFINVYNLFGNSNFTHEEALVTNWQRAADKWIDDSTGYSYTLDCESGSKFDFEQILSDYEDGSILGNTVLGVRAIWLKERMGE